MRQTSLFLIFLAAAVFGAADDSLDVNERGDVAVVDVLDEAADVGESYSDTLDDTVASDLLMEESAAEETGLRLVKRKFDGRQQVLLATGFMVFVITMMTAAQTWNPK